MSPWALLSGGSPEVRLLDAPSTAFVLAHGHVFHDGAKLVLERKWCGP